MGKRIYHEGIPMKKYLFTSESVTQGHPDKVCDLISDTLLDKALEQDENSKIAVECLISKDQLNISGQITSKAKLNYEEIARKVLKDIGYDNKKTDIDYKKCIINTNITKQSEDIELGIKKYGAGDQGIMFGYACDETEEYMPFAISIAHKLTQKIDEVRKNKIIPYLRPDGKVQVTVEYIDNIPTKINTILISVQHLESVSNEKIKKDIVEKIINNIINEKYMDKDTRILINPTGRFVIGGPLADTGVTGRKIIQDTYGGYSRHGGGAFSGKDATKVDRSAAYMLRHVAKNIVANKLAKKCELQISYAIGIKEPISLNINTFNTSKIPEEEILNLVIKKFNFEPQKIIEYLNLKNPIYSKTTNYGHFGRESFTWEKIKVDF